MQDDGCCLEMAAMIKLRRSRRQAWSGLGGRSSETWYDEREHRRR